MECKLCPRQCGVSRMGGAVGYCNADVVVRVARAAPHAWEEPCLSGTQGAGTVFFSHCSLGCVYCQNRAISGAKESGAPVTAKQLVAIFLRLQAQGVHNIELVTPAHYALQIIEALTEAKQKGLCLPVVYNCGGYESVDTLHALSNLIDVYVPDFKYYSSYYAARYSNAPDYFEIATKAVDEMVRQTGAPALDEQGIMIRGTLVRHLMLPGLAGDTAQVLRHLAARYGEQILVSLMRQYTPPHEGLPDFPELCRTVTNAEYDEATEQFQAFGLAGFLQEEGAIGESFIPAWDGDGT